MSKDTIFSNSPKAKTYSYLSRSYKPADASRPWKGVNNYLHKISTEIICRKDEMNLNDYKELDRKEILRETDIFFDTDLDGWRYTNLVGQTGCAHVYYRKLELKIPPYIDIREYVLLFPSDTIREGDEFFNNHDKGWYKSGNFGQVVGDIYYYRRKLKPLL